MERSCPLPQEINISPFLAIFTASSDLPEAVGPTMTTIFGLIAGIVQIIFVAILQKVAGSLSVEQAAIFQTTQLSLGSVLSILLFSIIIYFIAGVVIALVYNLIAKYIGGIVLEFREARQVAKKK